MKICPTCSSRFEQTQWLCPHCQFEPAVIGGFPCFAPQKDDENEGFDPQLFSELFALEGRHFWFRVRNRIILWALKKYFPGSKSFLEIGCGNGFVLSAIEASCPGMTTSGSEYHLAGLKFAAQRLERSMLWQMDARSIPYENEFDVIGAFDVLEHIVEDRDVLTQIHKAVKPGGGLILTVPQHAFLWSAADDAAHHQRRYGSRELRNKIEQAGFKTVRVTSFMTLLFPVMYLSRLMNRSGGNEYDPMNELKINSFINKLFLTVMRVESALIRAGVSMPFGGSLLLLAIKDPMP